MTPISKPHLRNVLKKLRAIQFDAGPIDAREAWDQATAAQEMLDFLAMLAGLKPVYLAGRGFGPPSWLQGVQAIAGGFHGDAVRSDRQTEDVRLPAQLQGFLEIRMEQRFAESTQDDQRIIIPAQVLQQTSENVEIQRATPA